MKPQHIVFPLKNLEDLFPTSRYQAKVRHDATQNRVTNRDIAHRVGVTMGSVQRWRTGGLRYRQADEVACRLGVHPSAIWPKEWQEVLDYERPRRVRPDRLTDDLVASPQVVAS